MQISQTMEHCDWLINNRNNKNQSDAATHGNLNMAKDALLV